MPESVYIKVDMGEWFKDIHHMKQTTKRTCQQRGSLAKCITTMVTWSDDWNPSKFYSRNLVKSIQNLSLSSAKTNNSGCISERMIDLSFDVVAVSVNTWLKIRLDPDNASSAIDHSLQKTKQALEMKGLLLMHTNFLKNTKLVVSSI